MRNRKEPVDYPTPLPHLAVLRGIAATEVGPTGKSLRAKGFRILEITPNSPQPCESIACLAHDDRCLTGARTVLDPAEDAEAKASYGESIVMPPADLTAAFRGPGATGFAAGSHPCMPGADSTVRNISAAYASLFRAVAPR